jgi:hypothetical protein
MVPLTGDPLGMAISPFTRTDDAKLPLKSSPGLLTFEFNLVARITGNEVPATISYGGGGGGGAAGVMAVPAAAPGAAAPGALFAAVIALAGACGEADPGAAESASGAADGVLVAGWFVVFSDFLQPAVNKSATAPRIIHFLFIIPRLFLVPLSVTLSSVNGAPCFAGHRSSILREYYHFTFCLCSFHTANLFAQPSLHHYNFSNDA